VEYTLSLWIASRQRNPVDYKVAVSATVDGSPTTLKTTSIGKFETGNEYKHISVTIQSTKDFDNILLYFYGGSSSPQYLLDDFSLVKKSSSSLPVCVDNTPDPGPLPDPVHRVCYKNYIKDPGFESGTLQGIAWFVDGSSPASAGYVRKKDAVAVAPFAKYKAHSGNYLLWVLAYNPFLRSHWHMKTVPRRQPRRDLSVEHLPTGGGPDKEQTINVPILRSAGLDDW
jgi:hypothetical protein